MAFIPPSQMDNERARAQMRDVEQRAADYARTHPDGDQPDGQQRGLLHRLLRALKRKPSE